MKNYDYVRHEEGPIYIVCGDNHPDDHVFGFPCYIPDPNGTREHDGTRYRKFPRVAARWLRVGTSRPSGVDHNVVMIPRTEIAERAPVGKSTDRNDLDPRRRAIYDFFEERLNNWELEWTLTGSHQFGLSTDDSDVDILIQAPEYETFNRFVTELHESRSKGPPAEILDFLRRREAERFGLSRQTVGYHLESKRKHLYTTEDFPAIDSDEDVLISFLPSQVSGSWTGFPLPDSMVKPRSVERVSSRITGVEKSHCMPRLFQVEVREPVAGLARGAELDVLTYHWPYSGSFDDGERIAVSGDYFPDEQTVYVRNQNHGIVPESRNE